MAAIISGKLVKLGPSQNAMGGTELLAERLLKGTNKELFKNINEYLRKWQQILSNK